MIQVQNLTKAFHPDQPPAVNQVTFTLNKGEVGCLIGTSGSGKTTTLKMINRLIEPTAGKIWVNGSCHSNSKAIAWRRGIGYVVQKAGLLPHLTVSENISLLPDILKRDRKSTQTKVEELLEMVNLPLSEYGARYPAELSGGQQQRVGIARALVEDPPVLLMDEPFGALDPITRSSLHDEFIFLNRKLQKTILLVTHDLGEAFKLGSQILLMDQGALIQSGSQEDFIRRPKNEFVEQFVRGYQHV